MILKIIKLFDSENPICASASIWKWGVMGGYGCARGTQDTPRRAPAASRECPRRSQEGPRGHRRRQEAPGGHRRRQEATGGQKWHSNVRKFASRRGETPVSPRNVLLVEAALKSDPPGSQNLLLVEARWPISRRNHPVKNFSAHPNKEDLSVCLSLCVLFVCAKRGCLGVV